MKLTAGNARNGAIAVAIALLAFSAGPARSVEPHADFVFDALGPAACEMPPPSFDISQFRAYADNTPDAPVARGELSGGLTTSFAGGGLYGADEQGGFVIGVQGMLFDDAPELTMLCMVLVRLGDSDGNAGPVVGEAGMDSAGDGSFLGVFKLVQRDAQGAPETFATGTVDTGNASFGMFDGILVEGAISIEGSYTLASGSEARPLSATITIPRAENVLRPALRLSRN